MEIPETKYVSSKNKKIDLDSLHSKTQEVIYFIYYQNTRSISVLL